MHRASTLFVLIGLAFTGCSHGPSVVKVGESDYFGTSKVHRYRLTNGMKVLILEDHSAPTFAYHTWFNVGSKDEEKGLTGLAHLFEHMMFKATKNYPEGQFDKILESAGAEGENAFTSRDYTGYVQSLPADKLELIATLEAERMVNLIVNSDALDKEREVVQNERRFRNENNPDGQLYERLYELAYGKHSYHWPVIGYAKDLANAKAKECEDFYKRYYAPNNATVVVVGDVSPSQVMAQIEKHYAKLPTSNIKRQKIEQEPAQHGERVETMQIKTVVEKLMIAYHIPSLTGADLPAIEIARNILGTGRSSRLHRKLVDGGIATGVELETIEHADPGLLLVFVNMQKNKTAKQAIAVIDREMKEVAAGRVSQDEIDRAVAMHRFSIFDGLASNHAKAQFLGFYETLAGDFSRGVEIVNGLRAVDKAAVARVTQNYFKKDNRTVVIGVPRETKAL